MVERLEKNRANFKVIWDFEFNLKKTTTSRRPHLILENKETKKIWICDMACMHEKLTKYRQVAFEMRERQIGSEIMVVLLVIGALGSGIGQAT